MTFSYLLPSLLLSSPMFDSLVTLNSLDCTRGVLGLVFSVCHCWFCITKLSDWLKKISRYNNNNNNNSNNNNFLWTYCAQLNMRMISCALQLRYFTRNKQKIMHFEKIKISQPNQLKNELWGLFTQSSALYTYWLVRTLNVSLICFLNTVSYFKMFTH